jgi:hypothetical protein
MDSSQAELRIWKHSHGTPMSSEEQTRLRNRSVLTIYRDTKKRQGENFRLKMRSEDFFYLCHGNDVQLFGQVVSSLEKPDASWVERRYRLIRPCRRKSSKFGGPKTHWAPNANSTSKLVPQKDLILFEEMILIPFFNLSLNELRERILDDAIDESMLDTLSSIDANDYEEAREMRVRHERIERIRNRELVHDAKMCFKSKHQKLYCEVCGFDFAAVFGERGVDFIEAHHIIPIARLEASTRLKIADLAMVCANCHRMLHRQPWVSVEDLRRSL